MIDLALKVLVFLLGLTVVVTAILATIPLALQGGKTLLWLLFGILVSTSIVTIVIVTLR